MPVAVVIASRFDFGLTRLRYDENGLIDDLKVRIFDGEMRGHLRLWGSVPNS